MFHMGIPGIVGLPNTLDYALRELYINAKGLPASGQVRVRLHHLQGEKSGCHRVSSEAIANKQY